MSSDWFDKKDSTQTVLNHLGDKVPQSIQNAAKRELKDRGYTDEQIRHEEWKRMD